MNSKRFLGLAAVLLAASLMALPVLSACAPREAPKEKVIKVGVTVELTGPVSPNFAKAPLSHVLAYWRDLNDGGGIRGIRVDYLWEDVAYNVERTVAAYKKFKDAGAVIIRPTTSVSAEAIMELARRDGIPTVGSYSTDKLIDPSMWHFDITPTYTQEFLGFLKWVKDNWKESRRPRVAQISWDVPMGNSVIEPGKIYAEKVGIDLGPFEKVPMIPLDTTPQLLRIKDAKADFVRVAFGNKPAAAQVLRDAKKLGLLGGDIKWVLGGMVANIVDDVDFLGEPSDGLMVINYYPMPYEPYPRIPWVKETLAKYVADPTMGLPYTSSLVQVLWSSYMVMVEGVGRAVDKVGYEKLDGQAVKAALETFKDFDNGIWLPLTYTPQWRQGTDKLRMGKVNQVKKVFDFTTGWFSPPTP